MVGIKNNTDLLSAEFANNVNALGATATSADNILLQISRFLTFIMLNKLTLVMLNKLRCHTHF